MLTTYKACSIYSTSSTHYTIVGIIDDGSDYSEYMSMPSSQIGGDFMLQQKISRELDFGFTNMVYITENKYNELLNKPINMPLYINYEDVEHIGYNINTSSLSSLSDEYNRQKQQNTYNFVSSYGLYYKNGSVVSNNQFVALQDNEVLLNASTFNTLFNTEDYDNRVQVLSTATEPLTVDLYTSYYDYNTSENVYTKVKTYTVVGFHSTSPTFLANSNTNTEIQQIKTNNSDKYFSVHIGEKQDYLYSSLYSNTIQEAYNNSHYGNQTAESFINQYVSYYKNNGSLLDVNNDIVELGDNEIIIRSYMLSSIAQGEELERLIDQGLTIALSTDYEGKEIVTTATVVGLTEYGDVFTSNKMINTTLKELLNGFDYSIVKLSNDSRVNEEFIEYCETFNKAGFKFTVQTGATPILDQFGDILNSVSQVLLYVGIGFAVFASLLLMNFISNSISYKKREIGILRALGARGSDVFGIFFNESSVIAIINFVLATIATIVTCGILNNVIITKLGLDLVLLSVGIRQIVLIFGISMLTAFIASFLPVMKIAKKKPIDAINNR
jgi:hypothetical protein